MKITRIYGGMAALGMLLITGCISHEQTIYRDPERVKVEFENDTAARHFYETYNNRRTNGQSERKTEVSLPIIFDHKTRVISGNNAAFNDAVALCDTSKDGKITEMEARIYAQAHDER